MNATHLPMKMITHSFLYLAIVIELDDQSTLTVTSSLYYKPLNIDALIYLYMYILIASL